MRTSCRVLVATVALTLVYTSPLQAQDKADPESVAGARRIVDRHRAAVAASILPTDELNPFNMQAGQRGIFPRNTGAFYFKVMRAAGTDEMMVAFWALGQRAVPFIVKGVSNEGLVADDNVDLSRRSFEIGPRTNESRDLGLRSTLVAKVIEYKRPEPPIGYDEALMEVEAADRAKAAADSAREAEERAKAGAQAKLDAQEAAKKQAADKLAKNELAASAKLKLCQQLIDDGKRETAEFRLGQLLKDYPGTKAAGEARKLLGK